MFVDDRPLSVSVMVNRVSGQGQDRQDQDEDGQGFL